MTEYNVLHSIYLNDLIEQVKEALKNGWICTGGVHVTTLDCDVNFYQALIKLKEQK